MEIQALFFHQIRVRRWMGVSWSWVAGLFCSQNGGVRWVGKLWAVLVYCWKCRTWWSVMWIGRMSAVFDLVRNVTRDGSLCSKSPESADFCWLFYSHVWDRIGPEKLWRRKFMIHWKNDLFNCKFIFTFPPDGCMEPTRIAMCFVHFVISHCSSNIRLMSPFFNWNVCPCFFLFVCVVAESPTNGLNHSL